MNIEVTVSDVTLDSLIHESSEYENGGVSIGDRVAHEIVHRLVSDRDGYYDRIRDRVNQVRDDEIREAVRPLILEALNAPVTPSTRWGEPTGQPTSLSALIVSEAQKAFTLRADNYSANQQTVVGKLVSEAVREALGKEIREEVAKARQLVGDQIGASVAAAVREGLRAR